MKLTFYTIVSVLFLIASCTRNNNPGKWILFSKGKNASLYYTFDKMSKTDKNVVKIWVKSVYTKVNQDDSNISYSKNMYMVNCSNSSYKVNPGFNYSTTDEMLSKTDSPQPDQVLIPADRSNREAAIKPDGAESVGYMSITPDSAAKRLYSVVCR